jgi:hypothetical protein
LSGNKQKAKDKGANLFALNDSSASALVFILVF